jgi:organic hydroperoxide reductase OsmC/OhrA
MPENHLFRVRSTWTGNRGTGTSGYRDYSRNHEVSGAGKSEVIAGSSDPAFRGDGSRYNPEELLVASLSACHMLWLLHLCADAGISVISYTDDAVGTMSENEDGSGEFIRVVLHPRMVIANAAQIEQARALHHEAHEMCFIARSVKFPVDHVVEVTAAP